MTRRPFLPIAVACVALAGCGLGPSSDDPEDVLLTTRAEPQEVADAWVELVCDDDPTEVDPEFADAALSITCHTRDPDDPSADPDLAELSVFARTDEVTESDSDDCDVPYMVLGGPLWTSRVYYSEGQQDLVDLGVEVYCQGN